MNVEIFNTVSAMAHRATLLVSRSGDILGANRAAAQLLGREGVRLVGRRLEDIVASNGCSISSRLAELARCGDPIPFALSFRGDAGDVRCHCRGMRFCDEAVLLECRPREAESDRFRLLNEQIRILEQEVERRMRVELELQMHREQLQRLVEERTTELRSAQAELIQAERLAVLGQLTATVSHELRNPLGTIQAAVFAIGDAIERNQLSRLKRSLQLAERGVKRCDRIINELLDYTKQREPRLESTPLDPWLRGVIEEQQWPSDVSCEVDLACPNSVEFDMELLRRAVVNVLTNAVQATQAGEAIEGHVWVRTRCTEQRVEIVIGDDGVGIPEEHLSRVFVAMFSTKPFGVGLGLPIVEGIMRRHGGGIEIANRQPCGVEVTLWLPSVRKVDV